MAAVSTSNSVTRLDDAEDTTNWAKDGGASPSQEPDFKYQGTYSVSAKIGTSKGGPAYTHPTTTDMTVAGDDVIVFKGIWTNKDVLQPAPSATHKIGNDASNYYEYNIADDGTQGDIDYPAKGGWLISAINPNYLFEHFNRSAG